MLKHTWTFLFKKTTWNVNKVIETHAFCVSWAVVLMFLYPNTKIRWCFFFKESIPAMKQQFPAMEQQFPAMEILIPAMKPYFPAMKTYCPAMSCFCFFSKKHDVVIFTIFLFFHIIYCVLLSFVVICWLLFICVWKLTKHNNKHEQLLNINKTQ